jgi:predicted nucleotidyltransferase component of viral defense system
MPIRLHAEDAALLREAIRYTAAETGFSARLIEKDYFCSVVLEHLAGECGGLTFKGGTCLSKVHGGFYRLSEDLDFSISTAVDSARGERRRSVEPLRHALAHVEERLPGFRIAEALRGFNNSTQYNAVLSYESLIDGHIELVSNHAVRITGFDPAQAGSPGPTLATHASCRPLSRIYSSIPVFPPISPPGL